MTPDDGLAAAAAALRHAVTEGRYAEAGACLAAYMQAVGKRPTPETAAQARTLVEWSRNLVLARRSAAAAQSRQLGAAPRAYRHRAAVHTLDMSG